MDINDYILLALTVVATLIAMALWFREKRRGWQRYFYRWPGEFAPLPERRSLRRRLTRAAEVVLFVVVAILFTIAIGLGASYAGTGM